MKKDKILKENIKFLKKSNQNIKENSKNEKNKKIRKILTYKYLQYHQESFYAIYNLSFEFQLFYQSNTL